MSQCLHRHCAIELRRQERETGMIDETNNKMSITKILLFFFLIVIAVGIAMMLLLPLFA
jgi:hypothetical protein